MRLDTRSEREIRVGMCTCGGADKNAAAVLARAFDSYRETSDVRCWPASKNWKRQRSARGLRKASVYRCWSVMVLCCLLSFSGFDGSMRSIAVLRNGGGRGSVVGGSGGGGVACGCR